MFFNVNKKLIYLNEGIFYNELNLKYKLRCIF
jgi:hypothetical protein